MTDQRPLSVPASRKRLPRKLTQSEIDDCARVVTVLCGVKPPRPALTEPDFTRCLSVALAARCDVMESVLALVSSAPATEVLQWLRTLHDDSPADFRALSAVLGGTYLLMPAVREVIGYGGQRRDPAPLDAAANDLGDGILDRVLEMTPIYVSPKA